MTLSLGYKSQEKVEKKILRDNGMNSRIFRFFFSVISECGTDVKNEKIKQLPAS